MSVVSTYSPVVTYNQESLERFESDLDKQKLFVQVQNDQFRANLWKHRTEIKNIIVLADGRLREVLQPYQIHQMDLCPHGNRDTIVSSTLITRESVSLARLKIIANILADLVFRLRLLLCSSQIHLFPHGGLGATLSNLRNRVSRVFQKNKTRLNVIACVLVIFLVIATVLLIANSKQLRANINKLINLGTEKSI